MTAVELEAVLIWNTLKLGKTLVDTALFLGLLSARRYELLTRHRQIASADDSCQ